MREQSRHVFVCITIILAVLCPVYAQAQSISFYQPTDNSIIQRVDQGADIQAYVSAVGVPDRGGVQYVLDMGTPNQASVTVGTIPYDAVFRSVRVGEHTIDAFIVDAFGTRTGITQHIKVGVGDIIVAVGDSITAGEVDDYTLDDVSADGRDGPVNGYGGYEPILNNMLTWGVAFPHSVPNEGLPGENTNGAKLRIGEIIARHPTALYWILAYGTNDANGSMSLSTYKSNLESMIRQIQTSIPGASVYLPRVFYHDETTFRSQYVNSYDAVISELTRTMPNVFHGADLDTMFRANHLRYPDHALGQIGAWLASDRTHHPNGKGMQIMGVLWRMAFIDRAFLVTDGTFNTLGSPDTDRVEVEAISEIGVTGDNMLEVCDWTGLGSPPPGTWFVGDWRVRLKLTGATTFTGQGALVTLGVEDTGLLPEGVSWNKVYLCSDNTILPTYRNVDSNNPKLHYLTARVAGPGVVSPVLVLNVAAPKTSLTISPAAPNGLNGWYITSPKITLTSVDAFGGMAKAWYAWDNGSDTMYYSSIPVPDGKHHLYYHGVDDSGNDEGAKTVVVKSDPTPPSTPTVGMNLTSVKVGKSVTAAWLSKDAESGIDKYWYAIGTGPGRSDVRNWIAVGTTKSITWKPTGSVGKRYYFSVKTRNRSGLYSGVGVSGAVTMVR